MCPQDSNAGPHMPSHSDDSGSTFTVFYAWQSDLPPKVNRRAILNALNEAAGNLEEELGGRILVDEATRGVSGSPYIPQKIFDKIRSSDAIIADVSTVCRDISGRTTANPNVTFELGYAVAHLGWDRVVLLLNSNFGPVEDLPFDFDRHRASPYRLAPELAGSDLKAAKVDLRKLIETAIRAIMQGSPKRPKELENLSPDEIKRERDLRQIRLLLSQLSLTYIDGFIEDIPHQINTRILHFWANFHRVFVNSRFHLYDAELLDAFTTFHDAWDVALSYDHHYRDTSHEELQIFGSKGDAPHTKAEQKAWVHINAQKLTMYQELQRILRIVRERYLEIDVNDTSEAAYKEYLSFKKSLEEG